MTKPSSWESLSDRQKDSVWNTLQTLLISESETVLLFRSLCQTDVFSAVHAALGKLGFQDSDLFQQTTCFASDPDCVWPSWESLPVETKEIIQLFLLHKAKEIYAPLQSSAHDFGLIHVEKLLTSLDEAFYSAAFSLGWDGSDTNRYFPGLGEW